MKSVSTRALSMLVAIPLSVVAILMGGWTLAIVFAGLYILAIREVHSLIQALGARPIWVLSAVGAIFLVIGEMGRLNLFMPASVILLLASAGVIMVLGETVGAALGFLLVVWVAWPMGIMLLLREMGPLVLLGTFALVWANDVAAYLVGSAFGRRRLVPLVSPGKTWEGSVAGFLATVTAAYFLRGWFTLPPNLAVGLGVVAAVFGQAGDLFESSLKRRANLKDSGSFMPGHGGVLDRLDAVLFGAMAVYYYVRGVLGH